MDSRHTAPGRRSTLEQRRTPLLLLREWWWNHDRRRHIAAMGTRDRRHPLDEGYVVDAFARQLEEIRNLPEVPR